MHFYQKNIGDFNNATRHLTRVERSLYSDAIELYYDTEKPLTTDLNRLNKLLLAYTNEEKEALLVVLNEFFTLTDEGYFNKRCHEEIVKYQEYMESKSRAGKASAEQRAKQKATSVEQAFNTTPTKQEPITNNQYPIPNTQEPIPKNHPHNVLVTFSEDCNVASAEINSAPKKSRGQALPKNWVLPKKWGEWALSERPEFTPEQVRKISESFKDHWIANANQAKAKKSDWEATWRNWVRNQKSANVAQFKSTGRQRIENTNKAVAEFLGVENSENVIEGEFNHD